MRTSSKKWFLLLLLLMATFVLAQGASSQSDSTKAMSFFDIPSKDVSVFILGYVFDSVGSVLTFVGQSTVLKNVLIDFNNAVLVLGAIVIIYGLLVSTLNTSNEGQALGEKWNSVWIPIRAAGGFAMMLPITSKGYALIQVFIMWVILQGVGAADMIWSHTLQALSTGESTVPTTTQSGQMYQLTSEVFVSEACMYFLAADLNKKVSDGAPFSISWGYPGASYPYWSFGVTNKQKDTKQTVCGRFEGDTQTRSPPLNGLAAVHNQILNQIVNTTFPLAEQYANSYMLSSDMSQPSDVLSSTAVGMRAVGDAATNMLQQYYASLPANTATANLPPNVLQYLSTAKNLGWALAGAYYLGISRAAQEAYIWNVNFKTPVDPFTSNQTYGSSTVASNTNAFLKNAGLFAVTVAAQLSQNALSYTPINFSAPGINSAEQKAIKPWLDNYPAIDTMFRTYILSTAHQWALRSFTTDPVSQLIQTGADIETQAHKIWLVVIGSVSALGVAATASLGIATPVLVLAMAWYAPFVMFTLMTAISTGFLFEVYVPLIPFILFTMGVLGWLILAIESMVAGPLLALGILHPEGQHQVWGKGEAGIMILASVFLRPALMVCGLFAAIPLSYALVGFVNLGFMLALYGLAGSTDTSQIVVFRPIATALFMSLYAIIVLLTFNRVYSLIHVLPDRILRWLGQPDERGYSAEQDLQQMQSGVKEAGQGVASSMKESMESQAGAAADYAASKQSRRGDEGAGGAGVDATGGTDTTGIGTDTDTGGGAATTGEEDEEETPP